MARAGHGRALPPQARVIRNDARIQSAVIDLCAREGWAGLTVIGVAKESGLSHRPVMARYRDRMGMAVGIWNDRLAQVVTQSLTAVVALCSRGSSGVTVSELEHLLLPFTHPDADLRAAAELMIVARYEPALAAAVHSTLGAQLDAWLTPATKRLTRSQAAVHSVMISLCFGLLLEGLRHPKSRFDLSRELATYTYALAHPAPTRAVPTPKRMLGDEPYVFNTGDAAWDALLDATLMTVGRHGYEAATTAMIADAWGHNESLIYRRYPTKIRLFLDACERSNPHTAKRNNDLEVELQQKYSLGISAAIVARQIMRPGVEHLRTIPLEQWRLSWHNPEMLAEVDEVFAEGTKAIQAEHRDMSASEARAWLHVSLANGVGMFLLAELAPGAWQLPYEVVTVPLADASR